MGGPGRSVPQASCLELSFSEGFNLSFLEVRQELCIFLEIHYEKYDIRITAEMEPKCSGLYFAYNYFSFVCTSVP